MMEDDVSQNHHNQINEFEEDDGITSSLKDNQRRSFWRSPFFCACAKLTITGEVAGKRLLDVQSTF